MDENAADEDAADKALDGMIALALDEAVVVTIWVSHVDALTTPDGTALPGFICVGSSTQW